MKTDDGKVILSVGGLKRLRKCVCLSQENLAFQSAEKNIPISIATIKRAESGKHVSYNTARKLAKFYGVRAIDLMSNGSVKQISYSADIKDTEIFSTEANNIKDLGVELSVSNSIYPSKSANNARTEPKFTLELQQFLDILNGCIYTRRTYIVCVTGKSGVGKTFLLEKFHIHASQLGCRSHYLPVKKLGKNGTVQLLSALLSDNALTTKPNNIAKQNNSPKNNSDMYQRLNKCLKVGESPLHQNNIANSIMFQRISGDESASDNPNSSSFNKLIVICLDDSQINNDGIVNELYNLRESIKQKSIIFVFASLLGSNEDHVESSLAKLNYPITTFYLPCP